MDGFESERFTGRALPTLSCACLEIVKDNRDSVLLYNGEKPMSYNRPKNPKLFYHYSKKSIKSISAFFKSNLIYSK